MRWFRKPPVHFAAIGVALFCAERYAMPTPEAERLTVTITAARMAQLEADLRRSTDTLDREALLERAVEDEVLFREALARGLDRDDRSIRVRLSEKVIPGGGRGRGRQHRHDSAGHRQGPLPRGGGVGAQAGGPLVRGILVHKMRLLLKRTSGAPAPDDAELPAYLERRRDRYLQPARVTFDHVYLAATAAGTRSTAMRVGCSSSSGSGPMRRPRRRRSIWATRSPSGRTGRPSRRGS